MRSMSCKMPFNVFFLSALGHFQRFLWTVKSSQQLCSRNSFFTTTLLTQSSLQFLQFMPKQDSHGLTFTSSNSILFQKCELIQPICQSLLRDVTLIFEDLYGILKGFLKSQSRQGLFWLKSLQTSLEMAKASFNINMADSLEVLK